MKGHSPSAATQDAWSCGLIRSGFTMEQRLRTLSVGSVNSRPLRANKSLTEFWQLFQLLLILQPLTSNSLSAAPQDVWSCGVIRSGFTMQQRLRTLSVRSVSSRLLRPTNKNRTVTALAILNNLAALSKSCRSYHLLRRNKKAPE